MITGITLSPDGTVGVDGTAGAVGETGITGVGVSVGVVGATGVDGYAMQLSLSIVEGAVLPSHALQVVPSTTISFFMHI